MTLRRAGRLAGIVLWCAAQLLIVHAAVAQPDPRQMSGVPLPVGDMANGTVTVRVIRGSLANVVASQDVELVVGGVARVAKTNEAGRAEFGGLPAGASVVARVTLDGQPIQSQTFAVPAAGGIRLMLVGALPAGSGPGGAAAGAPGAAPPAVSAELGTIVLGPQTRFVYEMGDQALTGFYILDLLNEGARPVQPATMFSLQLPDGVESPTIMQGSSPQGTIAAAHVNVAGPFAPGSTMVQVAFTLPYSKGTLSVNQTLPVALRQVTLLVEKKGDMQVESPQVSERRDVRAENDTYILGQGAGLGADGTLSVNISGLPHAPLWPRNVALALAAVILAAGGWAAARPGRAATDGHARRQKLDERRERLFTDLTDLEDERRRGALDEPRYEARRAEIVRALERIYAQLDADAAA